MRVQNIWLEMLYFPLQGRSKKPREQGLTIVIDKGLGLGETRDLLNVAGDYIDFYKLGFGTAALYTQEVLEEKIYLVKSLGIDIYPGGTFLEVAILQEKLKDYLQMASKLGFTAIEVSDGTINLSAEVRASAITMAVGLELKVLTEVGKKDPRDRTAPEEVARQIRRDLSWGAFRVIVEGRESGKDAGFFDEKGNFILPAMEEMLSVIEDSSMLIWEAPLKEQQQELILRFGPDVNLGNISPKEVLSLEALRVGLRSDTLRSVCALP
jgi:phosphosulfolactate synthase